MLVSCCFSPGWNNKKQCKNNQLPQITDTQKYSHHRFPSCPSPPSHQYIEKRAASENVMHDSLTHTFTCARALERTRREIYASKSKENAFHNELFCLLYFWTKNRLVFSENLMDAMVPCLRGTQRCWFCFVLQFFKQREKYQHRNTYNTLEEKSLWAIVKQTRTQTTLAHTQKATGKGWTLNKGWNKSELEHEQDTKQHWNTFTRWHLRHLH